jgi:hypothetical protein
LPGDRPGAVGTCGQPWPCEPARLALLAEYRDDRPALAIYLAILQAEAAEQLAELDAGAAPANLTARFLGWIGPRRCVGRTAPAIR